MNTKKLPDVFVSYAADTLAETNSGLTGAQIVKYCNSYAVDFGVDIPITSSNFGSFGSLVPNKRTALYRNLSVFNGQQQFVIIKELCELPLFENNSAVAELKKRLFERHSPKGDPNFGFRGLKTTPGMASEEVRPPARSIQQDRVLFIGLRRPECDARGHCVSLDGAFAPESSGG